MRVEGPPPIEHREIEAGPGLSTMVVIAIIVAVAVFLLIARSTGGDSEESADEEPPLQTESADSEPPNDPTTTERPAMGDETSLPLGPDESVEDPGAARPSTWLGLPLPVEIDPDCDMPSQLLDEIRAMVASLDKAFEYCVDGFTAGGEVDEDAAFLAALRPKLETSGWVREAEIPGYLIAGRELDGEQWTLTATWWSGANAVFTLVAGDASLYASNDIRLTTYLGRPTAVGDLALVPTSDSFAAYGPGDQEPRWIGPACVNASTTTFRATDLAVVPVLCDYERLIGVDLATGAERWNWPIPDNLSALAASTTAIVASTENGTVHVLDPTTGEERWDAVVTDSWGAADNEFVYISGEGSLTGHDPVTGEEFWKRGYPATYLEASTEGLLVRLDGGIFVIDPANGSVLLESERSVTSDYTSIVGAADGLVVTNAEAEGHLTATDLLSGSIVWEYVASGEVQAELSGGHVTTWEEAWGNIVVLDAATGTIVHEDRSQWPAASIGDQLIVIESTTPDFAIEWVQLS